MASFFTFPAGGFGGYLILSGPLRGKGLLRELILRMEERMKGDGLGARGWFIECDPRDGISEIFRRCGFRLLDYPWVQPPLPRFDAGSQLLSAATPPAERANLRANAAETAFPDGPGTSNSGPRLDLFYKTWGCAEESQLPSPGETEWLLSWLRRVVYRADQGV